MSRKVILSLGPVLSTVLFAALPVVQAQVFMETVVVGNPGNAPDVLFPVYQEYGDVDYVYRIGKFEVTAGQHTGFLNAIAATDTYELYHEDMASPRTENHASCRIQRTGSSGSFSYSVAGDWTNRPVNLVSWADAARFANWLHNGQPTGAQDLSTTESGSYYLNGATSSAELAFVERDPDATWAIPSKDEWHKAAYHKNDGVTGNYFDYPTGSDALPACECCPGGENSANYDCNGWDPDGLACGPPYYTANVGGYVLSVSPYGTFDQAGNVREWNEAIQWDYGSRGTRGGSFLDKAAHVTPGCVSSTIPIGEGDDLGFRVVKFLAPECDIWDTDDDIDIDLADFAVLQNSFSNGNLTDYALLHDCLDGPAQ